MTTVPAMPDPAEQDLGETVAFLDAAGIVVSLAPAGASVFGHRPQALIGRPLGDLIVPEQRPRLLGWFAAARPRHGTKLTGLRPNGEPYPLTVSLIPTPTAGFVAVLLDGSERRILQDEARAARTAADRALQERGHFLAEMSHELRTPLNAILGFAEIIAGQRFGPDAAERYRQYAEHIVASAEQLRDLIAELSTSLPATATNPTTEAISVQAMVAEVSGLLRARAMAKNITIASAIEGDPTIHGEPASLRQILLNLGTSAIDNTPDDGQVSFTANADADGRLSLAVTDSGGGIEAAAIPLLFEPHVRGHAQGNRPGLSVIKTLVEIHGGEFTIDSVAGEGATYRVALPGDRWSKAPVASDDDPPPISE